MNPILYEVETEANGSAQKFGDYTSSHEAYGVLAEEMGELLEAIRKNKSESVRHEAIQVAAVAMRLADHCRDHPVFKKRSGFLTQDERLTAPDCESL